MARNAGVPVRDLPNVADTCMAALALIRSGSTPSSGPHAGEIRRAVEFVAREVGAAEAGSLYVTSVRGTRVQAKLGTYIDTFLSALLLAEVRGQMPEAAANQRMLAALDKVMDKIERNQRPDGTWDNQGWAPILAQSVAAKAINRAAQAGASVNEEVRKKAEAYARGQFDGRAKSFRGEGSPGVALYSSAASLGAMQDSDNTNRAAERQTMARLERAASPDERKKAEADLARIRGNRRDLEAARSAVADRLADSRFIQGFGSNGGEEFLSYMSIGESLAAEGGEKWQTWRRSMGDNLERVQNQDGSWSGHHCITGRTFCTAAALLTLTVDRASAPLTAGIRRR
jgi:hypothetical protein